MTTSIVFVKSPSTAAIIAGLALCGCNDAPVRPAPTAAKPAAVGHDHDHGDDHDHDHAPAKDHDHGGHAHPGTLAEGVDALAEVAAGLKDHLAADAREAADDAVHGLGHLLEDVQGLVNESALADDAKAAATKALDDLFESFGKLDEALHAEPGKGDSPADVHASIAKRVEDAIAALRAALPAGDRPAATDAEDRR